MFIICIFFVFAFNYFYALNDTTQHDVVPVDWMYSFFPESVCHGQISREDLTKFLLFDITRCS